MHGLLRAWDSGVIVILCTLAFLRPSPPCPPLSLSIFVIVYRLSPFVHHVLLQLSCLIYRTPCPSSAFVPHLSSIDPHLLYLRSEIVQPCRGLQLGLPAILPPSPSLDLMCDVWLPLEQESASVSIAVSASVSPTLVLSTPVPSIALSYAYNSTVRWLHFASARSLLQNGWQPRALNYVIFLPL